MLTRILLKFVHKSSHEAKRTKIIRKLSYFCWNHYVKVTILIFVFKIKQIWLKFWQEYSNFNNIQSIKFWLLFYKNFLFFSCHPTILMPKSWLHFEYRNCIDLTYFSFKTSLPFLKELYFLLELNKILGIFQWLFQFYSHFQVLCLNPRLSLSMYNERVEKCFEQIGGSWNNTIDTSKSNV